ncbi:MAG: hypothetical protein ACE148_09580 [Vicinamibacterales bacterium]
MKRRADRAAALLAALVIVWSSFAHTLYGHPAVASPDRSATPLLSTAAAPSHAGSAPAHSDNCLCHSPGISEPVHGGSPLSGDSTDLVPPEPRTCPRTPGEGMDHPPRRAA